MRIQRLQAMALAMMMSLMAWGAPAMPGTRQVKQADGTLLTIEQRGDEHHHWIQTPDGMLLTEKDGSYYVADIDDEGQLQPTGILAHDDGFRNQQETYYLRRQQQRSDRFHERGTALRRAATVTTSGGYLPHTGSPRVLVVLAEYQDLKFTVNEPVASFEQYLNGTEQKDYGNHNTDNVYSIRQYFEISSHGQFSPQFDVVGPVTLPQDMNYYGEGSSTSERMTQLAKDAVALVADSIDLSLYDNNNDGDIELAYVIFAGYGQNQGGADNTMWAKVKTVNTRINDQFRLTRCGCNSELFHPHPNYKDYINGTGVFCHEFSHAMGLPDIYPTNSAGQSVDNQSMEKWDVMDNGLYLNNGFAPIPYLAWEQEAMGWTEIEPLTAISDSLSLLPVLEEGGKAYKIPNPDDDKEFIVLENLQQRGISRGVVSSGLLAYHVAYPYQNINMGDSPNNTAGKPVVALVPACGINMSGYLMSSGKHTRGEYTYNQTAVVFPGADNVTQLSDDDELPNFTFYKSSTDGKVGTALQDIREDRQTGEVSFFYINKSKIVAGDVNGDAAVNVEDVVAVVNFILGDPTGFFLPEAADVNGDTTVDVDDIVAMVNMILGDS